MLVREQGAWRIIERTVCRITTWTTKKALDYRGALNILGSHPVIPSEMI